MHCAQGILGLGTSMHRQVRFGPRLTGAIHTLLRIASIGGSRREQSSSQHILNRGDWAGAEDERRAGVLQHLYRMHAAEDATPDGDITYRNALPPDAWINEQLAARGERWRVHGVDGFRCEIFDVADSQDQPSP